MHNAVPIKTRCQEIGISCSTMMMITTMIKTLILWRCCSVFHTSFVACCFFSFFYQQHMPNTDTHVTIGWLVSNRYHLGLNGCFHFLSVLLLDPFQNKSFKKSNVKVPYTARSTVGGAHLPVLGREPVRPWNRSSRTNRLNSTENRSTRL